MALPCLMGLPSLATDASGAKITDSDTRYYPYGATRPGLAGAGLPTDRRFTGQREETGLGFYDYGARPYDPALGRFLQADTLVPDPGNPQSLNRYSYTLGNPLRYTDPSGHYTQDEIMKYLGLDTWEAVEQYFATMPDVLKMLLTSDLTWGSVLVAGNDGQSALRAMFLLLGRAGSDKYRLTLWDLDKGAAVAWDALGQYAQWEVFTDSGNGFARVYDNSPNISKGFSAPSRTAAGIRIPVSNGYIAGRWLDLDENKLGSVGGTFIVSLPFGVAKAVLSTLVAAYFLAQSGSYVQTEYPYIQAPYQGLFGTMYDEFGIPHSVSPLTISFQGPSGPPSALHSSGRGR